MFMIFCNLFCGLCPSAKQMFRRTTSFSASGSGRKSVTDWGAGTQRVHQVHTTDGGASCCEGTEVQRGGRTGETGFSRLSLSPAPLLHVHMTNTHTHHAQKQMQTYFAVLDRAVFSRPNKTLVRGFLRLLAPDSFFFFFCEIVTTLWFHCL